MKDITIDTLDNLSVAKKNLKEWKGRRNSCPEVLVGNSGSLLLKFPTFQTNGGIFERFIKPSEILDVKAKEAILSVAKEEIERCLKEKVKQSEKKLKEELLGTDDYE